MNRACAAIALCALLYSPLAIGQASEAGANLTKTLQSVARERILQFDRGDAKLWSPYVADGYLIATPSGRLLTREEQIASFEPPRPGYRDEFTFEDVHVRREGDTAVMSYVINEYEFWDTQKYLIPKLRKTDTYVLRNGRWLLLASQESVALHYYSGLPVLRWDELHVDLDAAVDFLRREGRHPVFVMEDWEHQHLRRRFPQSVLARLDWPYRAHIGDLTHVYIYDPDDRGRPMPPVDRVRLPD